MLPVAQLTPEIILNAAEEAIERFGYRKSNLVDVARMLGVSHGSIYRHFQTKEILFEAVILRWLETIHAPLWTLVTAQRPADERLSIWLQELAAIARRAAKENPELFQAYRAVAAESTALPGSAIERHWHGLLEQLTQILAQGRGEEAFAFAGSPRTVAKSMLDATSFFYRPEMVACWAPREAKPRLTVLVALLVAALRPVSATAE